jgi:hypothetical protein
MLTKEHVETLREMLDDPSLLGLHSDETDCAMCRARSALLAVLPLAEAAVEEHVVTNLPEAPKGAERIINGHDVDSGPCACGAWHQPSQPPATAAPSEHGILVVPCDCPGCLALIPGCWASVLCGPCAREDCEHEPPADEPTPPATYQTAYGREAELATGKLLADEPTPSGEGTK